MKKEIQYTRQLLAAAIYVFIFNVHAQQSDFSTLYKKASENIFFDHSNIINILNYLNANAADQEQVAEVAMLYSDYYYSKGEYEKSVEYIFRAGTNFRSINDSLKLGIAIRKEHLACNLKLHGQFDYYENIASEIIKSHNKTWCPNLQIKAAFEKAYASISKGNLKVANDLLNRLDVHNIPAGPDHLYAEYTIIKALAYPDGPTTDLKKALDKYKLAKSYNRLYKASLMVLLSDKLRKKNGNDEAIALLQSAENETAMFQNPYVQNDIYERLSIYFPGTVPAEVHKGYNEKSIEAYNKILENEISALNSFYKLYKIDLEGTYNAKKETQHRYYYILAAILIVMLIAWYAIFAMHIIKLRKLSEIISYLEIPNKLLEKKIPVPSAEKDKVSTSEKRVIMPEQTERIILEKLKAFEQSGKFTNPAMSLATLAGETDVNTKYLSEVIKKHYNDNYNTYLNKLRVNYIIEKLKNDPNYLNYKISYLAEESGFASHSTFTTIFRNITGISPTEFINAINKQIQQKAP